MGGPVNYRGTELQRFWKYISVSQTNFFNGSPCWEWTGKIFGGYGWMTKSGGGEIGAHRWAFENFVGKISDGLEPDHLCRNRCCANPDHIEAVTHRENCLRGVGASAVNAAKTHCKRGHSLEVGNFYTSHGKYRNCKICHQARCKEYWERRGKFRAKQRYLSERKENR